MSATRRRPTARPRWFVYVLECADGTLYVGIARDVAARVAAHEAGRGAKDTRGRGPPRLRAKGRGARHRGAAPAGEAPVPQPRRRAATRAGAQAPHARGEARAPRVAVPARAAGGGG